MDGERIGYGYDGSLLTSDTLSSALNASSGYVYDNDFRPHPRFTYTGSSVDYTYDNDSLLTGAASGGSLALSHTFKGYGEIGEQTTVLTQP